MQASAFDALTKLIQSPPGVVVAGGMLAGIVWKFFERVEAVLTDDTKLEMAVWLLGVKVGQKVEPWPDTFARVFDRVFGPRNLSWKCFGRSVLASTVLGIVCTVLEASLFSSESPWTAFYWSFLPFNLAQTFLIIALPDYLSLLETRYVLGLMRRRSSRVWPILMILDLLFTLVTAVAGVTTLHSLRHGPEGPWFPTRWLGSLNDLYAYHRMNLLTVYVPPAMLTSMWLWLYAGSGFLLKAARKLDLGFDWFNRKFDIEKKPLQSMGLVAGAVVAVVYWSVAVFSRVVKCFPAGALFAGP